MRVFISGPYTLGDVAQNVRCAIEAADAVASLGHTPFVPHLSHFWHLVTPHEYEFWIQQDLEWLAVCDAMFLLPGESNGAKGEIMRAQKLGIPVYTSIADLARARLRADAPMFAGTGQELAQDGQGTAIGPSTEERGRVMAETALERWVREHEKDPEFVADGMAVEAISGILSRLTGDQDRRWLAQTCGVTERQLNRWLNASTNLTLLTLARLAIPLGLNPRVIFEPAGTPRKGAGDAPSSPP